MLTTKKPSDKKFFESLVQQGAILVASLEAKASEEDLPTIVQKAYRKEAKSYERILAHLFNQVQEFDNSDFEEAITAHFHHLIGDEDAYCDQRV